MESTDKEIEINLTQEPIQNGKECDKETIYYGVHIPAEQTLTNSWFISNVYEDKIEAIKVVKKFKGARFKSFSYYPEAYHFAINGCEQPNNNLTTSKSEEALENQNDQFGSGKRKGEEKTSQFRGPKSQELVAFRKLIEGGYSTTVKEMIWDNPKYLVSSGDTPSILQEGCRYNALHIAAKSKNHNMCELILNSVSNVKLIRLLYGDDDCQDANARADKLLDLYLNTPDKGLNETPLHFAVKFGDLKVVELLVSYPECDKKLKNKFGMSPKMLIGDRCGMLLAPSIHKKIELLLDDTFYVPVFRTEGNCMPPVIGEAFNPSSPPKLVRDVLSPTMEIKAYAGPMDKEEAEKFRRVWKTPPRTLNFNSPSKHNTLLIESSPVSIKFQDIDKGIERVGRALATQYDVGWKEYWPFLEKFIDLASDEGLQVLERYLSKSLYGEAIIDDSLHPKIDLEANILSPITDLCKHFENIKLSDSAEIKNDLNPLVYLEKGCQVFAQRFTYDILEILDLLKTSSEVSIASLQTQLKPLEQLILSFMGDDRFLKIDFSLIHSRLSVLINGKLKERFKTKNESSRAKKIFEDWLEDTAMLSDGLCSDDEGCNFLQSPLASSKQRSTKLKQLACIVKNMVGNWNGDNEISKSVNNEKDCLDAWSKAKRCGCTFKIKFKNRTRNRNFRNGDVDSNKKLTSVSAKLVKFFDELSEDSTSSEEFYTPPSSPSFLEQIDDDDLFEDSICSESKLFIEGLAPTRTDYAVFNAISCAINRLDFKKYPNINKWFCNVSLYNEEERKSWSIARRHCFKTENRIIQAHEF